MQTARSEAPRCLPDDDTSLPAWIYHDPDFFELEKRAVFRSAWQLVCHVSDIPDAGDYHTLDFLGESVVSVRTEEGGVRSFHNVCRHRAARLLDGPKGHCGRRIVCPYHAWTYSLAGELRAAGSFKKMPGFDFRRWGLPQLPVTEWHGLVFVDASGGAAAPLEEALAKLDELVAPYEPERLVTAGRHSYDAAANWKIVTENYHECYHCPSIHPELCRVSPPKSGENYAADGAWIGGWMDLRDGMDTMSLDGSSYGVPLRGLDRQGLRSVIYVGIFPNVLLSLHPDYVMTHRMIPVAADSTRIECTWAFAPEAAAAPDFDPGYAVEFWDITNRQDWAACESVQRGLASPHASPGPLEASEDAVYSFVTTVARGYLGQPVWGPATQPR